MIVERPTFEDVVDAAQRISGIAVGTPVLGGAGLPGGGEVWLKAECLQETGSFKVRGAANTLLSLTEEERSAGVVAVSSGNHGRAVAFVAARLGVRATICLSERVPEAKVEAIRSLGAEVVVGGPGQDEAEAAALELVATGVTYVHPFDDPRVIAGQGTVGLEIAEQVPQAVTVVVPLSGGGLISGVSLAVKYLIPEVRVVGVSQERGPAMHLSLQAGKVVNVVEEDTLADALAGGLGRENHLTFGMCRDLVDSTVLVSEEEIAEAMRHLWREHGLRVEGGGAVGAAGLLSGKVPPSPVTVVVLSGGNVGEETWQAVLGG